MKQAETPTTGAEGHAEPLSGEEKVGTPDEPQKANKEARYRVERNGARAALEAAQQRITRYQRAEVERLASGGMSHPADLFSLSGNAVADYLNDDGEVDAEKVAADVAVVLAERPGLRKMSPGYDPSQGLGGNPPKPKLGWGELLNS